MLLFKHRYTDRRGKHIFVPTDECVGIGQKVARFIERKVNFPRYYYHYRRGGHVAALHRHLENDFFFRIDFKDFFYSIGRNRVAHALHANGFMKARKFAKLSCVKNPIKNGIGYALPIGFVQSPALATLVLLGTNVANVLDGAAKRGVFVSVYLDDLIGSGSDLPAVQAVYDDLIAACATTNLTISEKKLVAPTTELEAFNCNLKGGSVEVMPERVARFYEQPQTEVAAAAFERYVLSVSNRNYPSAA